MKRAPLAERVLGRIQRLVSERGFSHEKLAPHLGISASAVSKLLSGKNAISLTHIDGLCVALQISAAELMTDPGALIQPLSPMEAAILDVVRKMDRLRQHSLLDVLEWQRASTIPTTRGFTRIKDHLNAEEAMVLSLYRALGDADAQSGVVMQMRGYVQAKHEDGNGGTRGQK
jgi:transcriptional regulator with XRE-family HTH domain